jgi:hypothetical protein
MPKLTISASDMSRGIPAEEGWYKGKLLSFEQKANSKKDGYNLIPTIEYEGKDGVDRKIQAWFSNKSLGVSFAQFYCAVTDQKLDATDSLEIDTDNIKAGEKDGAELWIHVARDIYNGRIINKIDNYLAPSEEVPF